MGAERLIPEVTLAELWRIHPNTPYYWRADGWIASDETEPARAGKFSHFYYLQTIDKINCAKARNFARLGLGVPSAATLLNTPKSLLTTDEVAKLYGVTNGAIIWKVGNGDLPAIVLPNGDFRFPSGVIHAMLAATDGSDAIDLETARRVLCVGVNTPRRLAKQGRLARTKVRGHGTALFVTRASLLALLGELLSNVTPEEWWERRGDAPALSRLQVYKKYKFTHGHFTEMLALKPLPSITSPGGNVLLPQWAVDDLLTELVPLPVEKLTEVLPAPAADMQAWTAAKKLCTRPHQRTAQRCPSLMCLRWYINANRTNDTFDAQEWIARCLKDGATPLGSEDLVMMTAGASQEDIDRSVTENALRGVYLPASAGPRPLLIMRSDAVAWRRTQERTLYRDYHRGVNEV